MLVNPLEQLKPGERLSPDAQQLGIQALGFLIRQDRQATPKVLKPLGAPGVLGELFGMDTSGLNLNDYGAQAREERQ